MLKHTAISFKTDSLYLEESPYTSYVFPLKFGTTSDIGYKNKLLL